MKNEISKLKKAALKIAIRIWEKIGLLLVLFLAIDIVVAGLFFWNNRTCPKQECLVYSPLFVNKGLAERFFSGRIKKAEEFRQIPNKQFRDLFQLEPLAAESEESEKEID